MPPREIPRPVLKWAGGKAQLCGRILELLPARIGTYFEPFFGGGAVFFALAREGRFARAVVSDANPELINVYLALRDDVEGVIKRLQSMKHSEQEYYRVRDQKPRTVVAKAARTIYLNRTGFNGLYRVNSKGGFNVPYGRYTNPTICDEPNLKAVAEVLAKVEFLVQDFEATCKLARPGDAVYLDPPYLPLSSTAKFTSYDRNPFGMPEHVRLAKAFDELARRKVAAVLSNSCTDDSQRLYASHRIEFPLMARSINSKTELRGKIKEILVSNGTVRQASDK